MGIKSKYKNSTEMFYYVNKTGPFLSYKACLVLPHLMGWGFYWDGLFFS